MKISDVLGALIALVTVSICVVKLFELYQYIDEYCEDQTDEDSNR